jgi:chitinase
MTYDLEGGGSSPSWFNAPIYTDPALYSKYNLQSLDVSAAEMTATGVPKQKLMLGFPFFGTTCSGVTGPRQMGAICGNETSYGHVLNYNLSGRAYNTTAHAAWVPTNRGYLTYEDPASLTDKVNWVKSNGFGGWIMFNLNYDYVPTQNPQHPLLAAVKAAMGTNSSSYTDPSITNTLPRASGTVGRQ